MLISDYVIDIFYSCKFLHSLSMHWCANRFIFETEKHNGIAELLEILGRLVLGVTVNGIIAVVYSFCLIRCQVKLLR